MNEMRCVLLASWVVVCGGCGPDLDALAPFPCDEDGTCPAGFVCAGDLCARPACASVEQGASCATCGLVNPVECGNGETCAANSYCSGSGYCTCSSGYEAVDCSGRLCDGSCEWGGWWCRPTDLEARVACEAPHPDFAHACSCLDGRALEIACGEPRSCEELCRLPHIPTLDGGQLDAGARDAGDPRRDSGGDPPPVDGGPDDAAAVPGDSGPVGMDAGPPIACVVSGACDALSPCCNALSCDDALNRCSCETDRYFRCDVDADCCGGQTCFPGVPRGTCRCPIDCVTSADCCDGRECRLRDGRMQCNNTSSGRAACGTDRDCVSPEYDPWGGPGGRAYCVAMGGSSQCVARHCATDAECGVGSVCQLGDEELGGGLCECGPGPCSSTADCCYGYSCDAGTCTHCPRECTTGSECCSGICESGVCRGGAAGDRCVDSLDCASRRPCIDGECACGRPNELCQVDGECCTGRCLWSPGADSGQCDTFRPDEPGCEDSSECYSGTCVGGACSCTPTPCGDAECGDDGCGRTCGTGGCSSGLTCISRRCVAPCTPSCGSRVCGSDGCGGSCGTCPTGQSCRAGGVCQTNCARANERCTGAGSVDCCGGYTCGRADGAFTLCCASFGTVCTSHSQCCSNACSGGRCAACSGC